MKDFIKKKRNRIICALYMAVLVSNVSNNKPNAPKILLPILFPIESPQKNLCRIWKEHSSNLIYLDIRGEALYEFK